MSASPACALLLRLEDLPPGPWLELPAGVGPDAGVPAGGSGEALLAACLGVGFPEEAVLAAADSPRFVRPEAAMAFSSAFVFCDDPTAAEAARQVASVWFAEAFAHAVAAGSAESSRPAHRGAPAGRRGQGGQVIDFQVIPVDCELDGVWAVHRATITGGDVLGLVPIHVDLAVLAAADALVLVWLADTPDPFPAEERTHIFEAVARRLPR